MKKRLIFEDIIKYLPHKNAQIITGMRQVGKTTLMRQVFDKVGDVPKLWFDLDNPLEQKIFENNEYRNIYARLKEMAHVAADKRIYIFIDEIQNYHLITKVIKYLIDHYGVKFIVTCSSNFYLKNLFPESLSGRKFLYYLPPLSFRECLYFKDKIHREEAHSKDIETSILRANIVDFKKFELEYKTYVQFGGFPEAVTAEDSATKILILKNIFSSFFEKDLISLSDYADIRELRDLLLLLVPRIGSLLDITKLSSELGVDRPKIYRYLAFLQGTFFITLLPKFSRSLDRSVAGGRKVYFADTGLLNVIGQVNDAQLLENAVMNQLARYGDISFYNKRNSAEIDAILDRKIAFEVKLKGTVRDYQKLVRLCSKLGVEKAYVISKEFVDAPKIIPAAMV